MSAKSLLVVAIDFGTTNSGYAFSWKTDYQSTPLRISSLNLTSEESGQQNAKEPTCLLFNPNKQFDSFGYEAEGRYASLMDSSREEAQRWFYFEKFKMDLHKKASLSREMKLLDHTRKKSMLAIEVFAAAISYLKDHLMKTLADLKSPLKPEEITWVLTVPAIWDDSARQFMREAAIKADIPATQLILALEPEAASVFCAEFFKKNAYELPDVFSTDGGRFMTVDCGGGTVDISVFEVAGDSLRQLHRAEGTACGGTAMDDAFKLFLQEIVGFDGVTSFDRTEMLEMSRSFQTAKTLFDPPNPVTITIPQSVKEMLAVNLEASHFTGRVKLIRNKLLLESSVVENFIETSAGEIVRIIDRVLMEVGHVDVILLVGGYSESRVVQRAVKETIFGRKIYIPQSPALAVLKGAVLYGHRPRVITRRVSPYTYGTNVTPVFQEGVHDTQKAFEVQGRKLCRDVFHRFISLNQSMEIDTQLPYATFYPNSTGQTSMLFNVYRSTEEAPTYTTDPSCSKIGEVRVYSPDVTGERKRKILVTMSVSGTELVVKAVDDNTQMEFSTTCDFLFRR